jgi:hypothetical protein
MLIDMQVADRLHRQIDARMPGQEIEHVVEEADAGRDVGQTRAIEVDGDLDVGLFGLAPDGRCAHEMVAFPCRKRGPFNRLTSPSLLRYLRSGCDLWPSDERNRAKRPCPMTSMATVDPRLHPG